MDLKETILESFDDLIQEVTEASHSKEIICQGLRNLRKDISDCLTSYTNAYNDEDDIDVDVIRELLEKGKPAHTRA